MVDQLADDYANAGQPVVFLEQDVDNPIGNRYSRWWAAHGPGSVGLPLVMVDSGEQISNGSVSYYNTYKAMVDASLARPPQANITAQSQRVGDHFHFDIQVTNLSGVTLSSSNSATVNAIVYYEDGATAGVTKRYVRAVESTGISSLANGATGNFSLDTADISGVDWDKLHTVVLVDYRPGGFGTAYDMLQAAFEDSTTAPSGLAVYKSGEPDPVNPGDPLTYTIRVVNTSGTDLHATVTDNLPAQVTHAGATIWTSTITKSGGVWTTTFTVTVNAGYTGTLVNEVVVTTTEGLSATAYAITNGKKLYLPMLLKD